MNSKKLQQEAEQQQLQDEYLLKSSNRSYSAPAGKFFTVFRIGSKFKNNLEGQLIEIKGLDKLEKHNKREAGAENVDKSKSHLNRILIGTESMQEDVHQALEGVKIYKNSVVARELVLSAGNGFWDRMLPQDREKWINQNIKFLKENFGEDCVHAELHLDETTPHIHAMIVALDVNKRGIPHLNQSKYFDGKEKLIAWQDKYTNCMLEKFNIFVRGIRGSKAKHIDLKKFYALINDNLDHLSSESLLAYAKENFINRKQIEELKATLTNTEDVRKQVKELLKKNKNLQDENKLFEYLVAELADKYSIPPKEVFKIIRNKDKYNNLNNNLKTNKDNQSQREI